MTRLVAIAALVWLGGDAYAGAPFDGRWGADAGACTDESTSAVPVLTISRLSLSWPGALCTVGTSYLVRNAWHISARCWGEGAVSNVPIRLQMRGDRLVLDWGRARPEEMRRCP